MVNWLNVVKFVEAGAVISVCIVEAIIMTKQYFNEEKRSIAAHDAQTKKIADTCENVEAMFKEQVQGAA